MFPENVASYARSKIACIRALTYPSFLGRTSSSILPKASESVIAILLALRVAELLISNSANFFIFPGFWSANGERQKVHGSQYQYGCMSVI